MQWSKEKQTDKGRQYNDLKKNNQTKVDNTMVKRKTNRHIGRQYNGLKKNLQTYRSTIQWTTEKQTDKGRQYNGLKKNKQTKVDNTMV
jgi:hypothetical protein